MVPAANEAGARAPGGHAFRDPALLAQALTHRSAGSPHNERLEFLGDALVNQFVAEALYRYWPKADEGALTRARAELVRESALASIARQLDLGPRLVLGPGEMKTGGHRRDSILADAVEALVAAIYLDSDFATCRDVVLPWFAGMIEALDADYTRTAVLKGLSFPRVIWRHLLRNALLPTISVIATPRSI